MNLTEIQKKLLNDYQSNFPICERPYSVIAKQLNITEDEVIASYQILLKKNLISRIGAIINSKNVGASTLVAMSIPITELNKVADFISAIPSVNHNYQREHNYNLWFVLTGSNDETISNTLDYIRESWPSYPLLDLPMVKAYHVNLGFPLWN